MEREIEINIDRNFFFLLIIYSHIKFLLFKEVIYRRVQKIKNKFKYRLIKLTNP
jgi:hypothetical protein